MRNITTLVRVIRIPAPRILKTKAEKVKENRLVKLIIVKNKEEVNQQKLVTVEEEAANKSRERHPRNSGDSATWLTILVRLSDFA